MTPDIIANLFTVIPIEFRKKLGIEANKKVLVSLSKYVIMIYPRDYYCALCGQNIEIKREFRLCDTCFGKIKAQE